jgi:hypothetical protein
MLCSKLMVKIQTRLRVLGYLTRFTQNKIGFRESKSKLDFGSYGFGQFGFGSGFFGFRDQVSGFVPRLTYHLTPSSVSNPPLSQAEAIGPSTWRLMHLPRKLISHTQRSTSHRPCLASTPLWLCLHRLSAVDSLS